MKNRICVIFTGGTIGSDSDGKNLSLSGGSKKLLIDLYRAQYGDKTEFDVLAPIDVLSENIQPGHLEKLYDCIKSVDVSLYGGVIVTHGTDTLCFTVNWLSLALSGFPLPIVFVSALYPLTDKRSYGVDNFAGAVTFIESGAPHGVYCSFRNDNENVKIHLGSRLVYPDEITGFYHSAAGAHLAEIEEGRVIYNSSPLVPTVKSLSDNGGDGYPHGLCTDVMLITMRSLLDFAVYDFSKTKPQAVIIELSHSGTVCTEGGRLNFKKFAAYCKEQGVQVVIAPVMSKAGVYASMKDLPENVMICYDTTIEMTIVKVMSALAAKKGADAFFGKNYFFEQM